MAKLWPSSPDTSAAEESDPRVIGFDDDGADELLSALSSNTARRLLAELHEEPATPSTLADRIETSLQNTQYHLGNLHEADLVEVIDTVYSEKGREMSVYAPADRPLVLFASPESERTTLKSMLTNLLGAVGVLALGSLLVQALLSDLTSLLPIPQSGNAGAGSSGGSGGMSTMAVETAAEQAAGLPPGLLFFLGGAVVLLAGFAVWYARR